MISDHYLPWIGPRGSSPFVHAVLGGIATATERIAVGATCRTSPYRPALIAQSAAIAAVMPGSVHTSELAQADRASTHLDRARRAA